jgi:hypothetical protein
VPRSETRAGLFLPALLRDFRCKPAARRVFGKYAMLSGVIAAG